MKIGERKVTIKGGKELKLRTPGKEDAEKVLSFRREVAGETIFLTRYPYEIENSIEKEREIIGNYSRAEHLGMLGIFDDDNIVAITSVSPIGLTFKTRHRASAELVVRKNYWNLGL